MEEIRNATGLTGMLRSFAQVIKDCERRESIAFVGMPFTCTPLIDFFVYVIRDLVENKYYFPDPDLGRGYELYLGGDRIESAPVGPRKVDIVVVMGGVAMPGNWEVDDANGVIEKLSHKDTVVVGACFMDMFEKAGWIGSVPFDYIENCHISTDAYKV
ncbi:MAG TPA: DUF2124 family protein [Candidatus Methanofastidiosa archaeon]|nr:DUF2124 family protein [Candidatus Methanofastidiosa archaeon]HPR41201.1 DUF2124 family protein [Candidatus Methanofastidiosa archaeon]